MKISDHWVNGVNENKLLVMLSLIECELWSKIIKHGTIFKLELGEWSQGMKGNEEYFTMITEGKWVNITKEKLRIP